MLDVSNRHFEGVVNDVTGLRFARWFLRQNHIKLLSAESQMFTFMPSTQRSLTQSKHVKGHILYSFFDAYFLILHS